MKCVVQLTPKEDAKAQQGLANSPSYTSRSVTYCRVDQQTWKLATGTLLIKTVPNISHMHKRTRACSVQFKMWFDLCHKFTAPKCNGVVISKNDSSLLAKLLTKAQCLNTK